MRNSPWYFALLIAFIGGVMGYVYFTSEIHTVQITGKRIEEGRSRYGSTSDVYVLMTDQGRMPILKFPIIGYVFGVEDVYNGIRSGSTIQVRVGNWPPSVMGRGPNPHIMAIY